MYINDMDSFKTKTEHQNISIHFAYFTLEDYFEDRQLSKLDYSKIIPSIRLTPCSCAYAESSIHEIEETHDPCEK